MTTLKMISAAVAISAALLAVSAPARAAAAHNLQTSAHTSNANDTIESALAKQAQSGGSLF